MREAASVHIAGRLINVPSKSHQIVPRVIRIGAKQESALCQNCVTRPRQTLTKIVIYGELSTHIDVAESR